MQLDIDRQDFLANYWQVKPLLIRNAIADFVPPLSADELAGLALEAEVESRLIECCGGEWSVSHGPFESSDFHRDTQWTLLVQAVDHYLPAVERLRQLIDFLPQWRLDDVMVSYAVDGASVGPHFDNYDVFLLQGSGQRLWRVGQRCTAAAPLLPHDELRILRDFDCEKQYLLNPGDVLYLPPGVAHWGIAQGECTTYSIGFRAPRLNDMVSRWVDDVLQDMDPDQFYCDIPHGDGAQVRAGEIRPADIGAALEQLRGALTTSLNAPPDDTNIDGHHWFGELVTEPRDAQVRDGQSLEAGREQLRRGGVSLVSLYSAVRLAWQQQDDALTVYANGVSCPADVDTLPYLQQLCDARELGTEDLASALKTRGIPKLLGFLLENGCIEVS